MCIYRYARTRMVFHAESAFSSWRARYHTSYNSQLYATHIDTMQQSSIRIYSFRLLMPMELLFHLCPLFRCSKSESSEPREIFCSQKTSYNVHVYCNMYSTLIIDLSIFLYSFIRQDCHFCIIFLCSPLTVAGRNMLHLLK